MTFIGVGTLVNVVAVLVGATIGSLAGNAIPRRVRDGVTVAIGLTVVLLAATALTDIATADLAALVGSDYVVLVVFGGVVLGSVVGSWLDLETRLEALGVAIRHRLVDSPLAAVAGQGAADRQRFVDGFVAGSLLFCAGPLTILGSLSEGLGLGPDQLLLKSTLDLIASIALAAAFGWGVAATVVVIVVVQGGLTLIGVMAGDLFAAGYVAAMTVAGGLLLLALSIRLLGLRDVRVADLLPALVTTPFLVWVVASL